MSTGGRSLGKSCNINRIIKRELFASKVYELSPHGVMAPARELMFSARFSGGEVTEEFMQGGAEYYR